MGTTLPTVVLQPADAFQVDAVVAALDALSIQPTPVVTVELDLGGESLLATNPLKPPTGVQVMVESGMLYATWYVDSSTTSASPVGTQAKPFPTILDAIDNASPGDLIVVEPGNGYSEADPVDVPNLSILGEGAVLNGQVIPQSSPGFTVTASGVTISGFTIEDFDSSPGVVVSPAAP